MSTDIFRRYLDLLNEARGPAPTEFTPTHFHKNFLGVKIPLMQTPGGSFWWMTTDPDNPRAGRTIQPWIGNTKDRSSSASVDGTIVDKKPVEFPDGTNWEENPSVSQGATPSVSSDLVPPNTNVALPSSGTFSNDDALAALAKKQSVGGKQTSDGQEDGPGLAGDARCAICGTTKMEHSGLNHTFKPGDNVRPGPVPQTGPQDVPSGGGDNVSRIKQLQKELLAAGANLGTTGANHDGIDGDMGPLTRAAMAKYPDIAAKYKDLGAGQGATPPDKSGIEKLNGALTTIEGILTKYKVKLNEDQDPLTPADQMKQWRSLMELTQADMDAAAAKRTASQAGNQSKIDARYAADAQAKKIGPYYSDTPAKAMPYSQAAQRPWAGTAGAAAAAETGAVKSAAGAASKTLGRVAPGVGAALGAYDAYNRAKQGDYTGAGISGLAGIASLFPGPGTWIAGGLLALGLARDLTKEPTVAISAEDAKTIAENIKIIQDWQKDPANRDALTPELKTRIANVLKGVATLGVPTESATPAGTPAGTPATTPAANSKLNQINQTLDSMDKLLKKNNYESVSNKQSPPLTEAEHMARLRNIVNEDWSDWIPDLTPTNVLAGTGLYQAGKAAGKKVAGAAPAAAAPAAAAPAAAATASWFTKLNQGLSKAWSMAKTGGKWGLIMAAIAAVYVIYRSVMDNPDTARAAGINVEDMEQFNQLNTQLQKIVGDEDTFNSLPPEVQQKITAIAKRSLKMAAGISNRKALEP